MTALGDKLTKAVREALVTAKCDHELELMPPIATASPSVFERFYCSKCKATFYVPKADK